MSYEELLRERRIHPHRLRREELRQYVGDLWKAYERALADAKLEEQSADGRFQDAYTAVRLLAEIVMIAEGYRPASGPGQHETVLKFLEAVPTADWKQEAAYFQDCRKKRNRLIYRAAGVVSISEVETLIHETEKMAREVWEWIKREHRELSE